MYIGGENTNGDKVEISEYLESMNGVKVPSSVVFVEAFRYIMRQTILWVCKKDGVIKLSYGLNSIQWVVSVPAIWSDKSKDLMVKWFNLSGATNKNNKNQVILRYEPDCASLSVLNELRYDMHV